MSRIILQLFAVGFCFAIGQALQCYHCKIGFWNLCITTEKTCASEEQCFSGIGKAASFIDVKMKGCLPVARCNKTEDVSLNTNNPNATIYKMTKTCCDTNLCNAAPGLPGTPMLSLGLASVTALLIARILV